MSLPFSNGGHEMLDTKTQERVALRLRRIEGQVRGLQRMVESSKLCVDLLTQIAAVQAALKSAGDEILHHHLRYCVPHSFGRRLRASQKARLEEMEKIFVQYCKEPRLSTRSQKNSEEH
jgi:CsoR family transcriptional regulator, copper-sensing transcriptional repressor